MSGLTAQSAFVLQIEGLNPYIDRAVEFDSALARLLGTGEGEAIRTSTHAFRVRLQVAAPSDYGFNNLDGGSLPLGVASRWDQFTLLPNPYVLPIQFSLLARLTGDSKEISSIDPVSKTIADVSEQAAKLRDLLLCAGGDGSLATVDSTSSTDTIVLRSTATTTVDGRGAHLLEPQQQIQVMSNAYVLRGTTVRIKNVFKGLGTSQSIQLETNFPVGTIAGDFIIANGLPAGAPVGINGLTTFINTSTAGTLMGLPRTLPYVVANGVNAANGQMTVPMLRLAKNQIKQKLGTRSTAGLFWHMHTSQLQAYEELGWQLQQITMPTGKAGDMDLMFRNFTIDGDKVYENIHADQTRADLVNKKSWLMVKWGPTSPFWVKTKSGNMVFSQYDITTGAPTTNELMYLQEAYQWANINPGLQGGVTSLRAPAGN